MHHMDEVLLCFLTVAKLSSLFVLAFFLNYRVQTLIIFEFALYSKPNNLIRQRAVTTSVSTAVSALAAAAAAAAEHTIIRVRDKILISPILIKIYSDIQSVYISNCFNSDTTLYEVVISTSRLFCGCLYRASPRNYPNGPFLDGWSRGFFRFAIFPLLHRSSCWLLRCRPPPRVLSCPKPKVG